MKHAPGPAIGVKGYVNTQDGESLCHRFKAYGVVEGTCGGGVVGLLLLLMCLFTPIIHTIGGVDIGVNSMGSSDNESHHHTHVSSTPGHHTDHLGTCANTFHSCIHSVDLIPLPRVSSLRTASRGTAKSNF